MNHTEKLTRYVANFVDELAKSGLEHVVISPGSRSTPLAMLFTEYEQMQTFVAVDERSASFFALGMAKETNKPVALVCTSGTAAANYYPAIIEAYYSRVPLLILTADRPHELRSIGASQTIKQINMYGDHVKWFQEMALPESTPEMLQYVRNRASRAILETKQGNPGPVHLNFPFREPLIPDLTLSDLWGDQKDEPFNPVYEGMKRLSDVQIEQLLNMLAIKKRGVFVCGPQVDASAAKELTALARLWNVPILADPISQLRAGSASKEHVIEGYDTIFRYEALRKQLRPDFIIRFGAMPISKSYLFYLQEHEDILQFVVENDSDLREPTNHRTEYIFSNIKTFCQVLLATERKVKSSEQWLRTWQEMNGTVKKYLQEKSPDTITEGIVMRELIKALPHKSRLFVGNSMAVRDLDTFFMTTDKEIYIHANRGVSGIDGVVSSALGVAATANDRVTLVLGDLSFYHDLNGLHIAKHYGINITILLINNNGGGIFSFLPQANEKKHFEALFGTPLNINFEKVVSMYGGHYQLVTEKNALLDALEASYTMEGLSVIEVQTDREENVNWHRNVWQAIEQELDIHDE